MTDPLLPTTLSVNAWTGSATGRGKLNKKSAPGWAVKSQVEAVSQFLAAPPHLDLRRWDDPEVGWGLVLPENEQITFAARAAGEDAPEPIRSLLAARNNAPVFRYRPDLNNQYLRRYFADSTMQDVRITSAGKRGVAIGCLPCYLLIYAPPTKIPWSLQYAASQACFVGRLDLEGDALANYVTALTTQWSNAASQADRPVVWATDHGSQDITTLMREIIAEPVARRLRSDDQIGDRVTLLSADDATGDKLIAALTAARPALVISTSHGMTGPLDNLPLMAQQLGVLVDSNGALVPGSKLLDEWQPDGALWYAHACCSAGSDSKNSYAGLVTANSSADKIFKAVASLGAQIAPLPKALLGAAKPLRAFIGHVEPTCDWTIRDPNTGQRLTETIQSALYNRLFQAVPETVGMALQDCYRHVGELFAQWNDALGEINRSDATLDERERARRIAMQTQLTALDRQSMVILGDPTVALPPLAPAA
jgi:hypothetical protein